MIKHIEGRQKRKKCSLKNSNNKHEMKKISQITYTYYTEIPGDKETYTRAPPALPNLVTLPFPNELFMSFIAASNALCCNKFVCLLILLREECLFIQPEVQHKELEELLLLLYVATRSRKRESPESEEKPLTFPSNSQLIFLSRFLAADSLDEAVKNREREDWQ